MSRVRNNHKTGTKRVLVFVIAEGRGGLIGIHYSITLDEVRCSLPPGRYRFVLQKKADINWEHIQSEEVVVEKMEPGVATS